jgi:hypothetical protein
VGSARKTILHRKGAPNVSGSSEINAGTAPTAWNSAGDSDLVPGLEPVFEAWVCVECEIMVYLTSAELDIEICFD